MKNPVPFTHLLTLLSGVPSRSRTGYCSRSSGCHPQSPSPSSSVLPSALAEGCIPTVPDSPLPPSVSDWAESRLGFRPDPLQAQILDSPSHRLILLCARQFGKSTLAAIKALHFALARPSSTVLCVSPTLRRSTEWLRLVQHFFSILATPTPQTQPTEPRGSSPQGCDQAVQTQPPLPSSTPHRAAGAAGPPQATHPVSGRFSRQRFPTRAPSPSPTGFPPPLAGGCIPTVPPPANPCPASPTQTQNRDFTKRTETLRAQTEPRGSSPKGCDQAVQTQPPQPSNTPHRAAGATGPPQATHPVSGRFSRHRFPTRAPSPSPTGFPPPLAGGCIPPVPPPAIPCPATPAKNQNRDFTKRTEPRPTAGAPQSSLRGKILQGLLRRPKRPCGTSAPMNTTVAPP
ncbi:MAG: hypothetical protein KatS3mg005_1301 [Bryobacteraceae bacterium]|nr:MAG: hypothetical protein KatS3mg005_1301 [Bryobacteraceae bacterium]